MNTTKKSDYYFLTMSVIFLIVISTGFFKSFFFRGSYYDTSLPGYLIIHGILLMSWYLVFFYQTMLVSKGKTINHKQLGPYFLLLIIMITLANLNVLISVASETVTGVITFHGEARNIQVTGGLVVGNMYLMTTSLILFAIAYFKREKPEIHKRAILGASVIMLGPAWDRFIHPVGLQQIHPLLKYIVINVFPVSMIIYDFAKRRKPYWITLLFFLFMVLTLPIIFALLGAGWGEKLTRLLG